MVWKTFQMHYPLQKVCKICQKLTCHYSLSQQTVVVDQKQRLERNFCAPEKLPIADLQLKKDVKK